MATLRDLRPKNRVSTLGINISFSYLSASAEADSALSDASSV